MSGQNIMGGMNRSNVQRIVKTKAEGSNYIGVGDNLLDFGAEKSFLKEDGCGKIFSMNITNASADTDIKLALFAGNFESGSAYLDSSNPIAEGTVATNLTCNGTPEKIDALISYLKANPTRLRAIKVKADNESQLDFPIVYRNVNPFNGQVDQKRIPAQYQRSGDNNTKVIELTDINWLLGPNNILMTTIGKSRSVVISLVFGASLDCEKGLMKKADEAAANAASLGIQVQ